MSGGVKGGGEVQVEAMQLYPNSVKSVEDAKGEQKFLDLLSIYVSFSMSESVLTPFITGTLMINDSNDMIPDYPILGANLFHFKYNVKDGTKDTEREIWMRVIGIENVIIQERKQLFTLKLISEEGYKNMNTALSSSFMGEPHTIVGNIFNQNLKSTHKRLATEPSIGGLKFVCPMWKPSQAIKWVTNRAISMTQDNPGYFFYESVGGFYFSSTTTLLNKERNLVITDLMSDVENERDKGGKIKKGYLYKIPGVPVIGSDGKPQSGMVGSETTQNVDDFRVLERQKLAADLISGHIASKHITHDIFHKNYTVETYNYWDDFKDYVRLAKNAHFDKPYEPVSSNINIMVNPKHSRIHSLKKDELGFRTIFADGVTLKRKQIMKQLDDEVVENFEAPGNPIIECGRLLEFNYPAIRKVEGVEDVYNKKYSGLYLIRDCMHMFSPISNQTATYKVDMNIVKDGWNA